MGTLEKVILKSSGSLVSCVSHLSSPISLPDMKILILCLHQDTLFSQFATLLTSLLFCCCFFKTFCKLKRRRKSNSLPKVEHYSRACAIVKEKQTCTLFLRDGNYLSIWVLVKEENHGRKENRQFKKLCE